MFLETASVDPPYILVYAKETHNKLVVLLRVNWRVLLPSYVGYWASQEPRQVSYSSVV